MSFAANFLNSGALLTTAKGKVTIGFGVCTRHKTPVQELPTFYFPDFFLNDSMPWRTYTHVIEMEIDKLKKELESFETPPPRPLQWHKASREGFSISYTHLERLLKTGLLSKGVPYIFETAEQKMCISRLKHSLLALLKNLKVEPLYGYGFWDENEGLLGATPELLFKSTTPSLNTIETVACAGTKESKEEDASLLKDAKELHEHNVVIQGIVESLLPLTENVTVHETKVLRLPMLTHMLTPLTANFEKEHSFHTIVSKLHPTPALGAAPRKPGLAWLTQEEKRLPRGRHGAPIGLQRPSETSICYVAIRNVQWQQDHLKIGAGCGVVIGSHPDREWEELNLKISATKKILSL